MIAASELNMTNGEFAFVGFELDVQAAWDRQSLSFKWSTPGILGDIWDISKYKLDFFSICNIMFSEEVPSLVKLHVGHKNYNLQSEKSLVPLKLCRI